MALSPASIASIFARSGGVSSGVSCTATARPAISAIFFARDP